jgi:hypothetical protein
MAALTSTAAVIGGTSPSAVSVSTSDTIASTQFGASGVHVRVINAGATTDTVTIVDPNLTIIGSTASNPTVTVVGTSTKVIYVPLGAVSASTGSATIQHSTTTSITCEVWKVP